MSWIIIKILDYEISEREAKIISKAFKNRLEEIGEMNTPVKILEKIGLEFGLRKRIITEAENKRRIEKID